MKRLLSGGWQLIVLGGALILLGVLHQWLPLVVQAYLINRLLIRILYFVVLLLIALQLVRRTVSALAATRHPARIFLDMDRRGILRGLLDSLPYQRSPRAARARSLITWSLVLIAFIVGFHSTQRFDAAEISVAHEFGFLPRTDSLRDVGIFMFATGDDNPTQYLRDLVTLTAEFKTLGARVVVAQKPRLIEPRKIHAVLLDSIRNTGITVLYEDLPHWGYEEYPPDLRAGAGSYAPPIMVRSNVAFYPSLSEIPAMIEWRPCTYNRAWLSVDVALPVVSKYLGNPDSLRPICRTSHVDYGMISVPVVAGGRAFAMNPLGFDKQTMMVGALRELDSDTLQYLSYSDGKVSAMFPQLHAPEIRGRIVIIDWTEPNQYRRWAQSRVYAGIIESLLRGEMLTVFETLPLLIAVVLIWLSAVCFLRFRISWAIALTLAIACMVFGVGMWLSVSRHIVMNAAYPALAGVLSAVLFPLVRLAHENPRNA